MGKRPVVLAITSDLHCGSTVALCPPEVPLDDGGAYKANKAQLWMWACWSHYWNRVEEARKEFGGPLYQLFNGDLVDGNHHGTTQITTGNPNGQANILNDCMKIPLSLKPDKIWIVRGTDAHVGQSACSEERIAEGLRKDKRPIEGNAQTGTASHWHAKANFFNRWRLDFAHHGRVGTRPWTKPNVSMNLAAEIFHDHAKEDFRKDRKPTAPHLAIRSHMHQYVDTGDTHPTRLLQTPAWQLATSFIHRIAAGKVGEVGGIIVILREDKAPEVLPQLYSADEVEPCQA